MQYFLDDYLTALKFGLTLFMKKMLLNNGTEDWIYAGLIMIAVFFFSFLLKKVIQRRLGTVAENTVSYWDDMVLGIVKGVHVLFLLVAAVYCGSLLLTLPPSIKTYLSKAFMTILLFQMALVGTQAVKTYIEQYRHHKVDSNAAAVTTLVSIEFVIRLLLWSLLLLVALDNLGINVTTFIAGLGISGIAVALAVQNILGDLFASFSIVFDKPFVIGDFIIVGDFLGTVEYIGLKTTRIRSLSGEQLIFSNADLLQSRIRNFKRMQERRVVFSIGVLYQTPLDKVRQIPAMLRGVIEEQSSVRFDRAHFKDYGTYALNFEIVYWIQTPDYDAYMNIQQNINLSIYQRFEDNDIQFAYPTQTIMFK
jgi:small-conductance mechanosensitive channel